jgi:heme-degrading monooxygenase HmoA
LQQALVLCGEPIDARSRNRLHGCRNLDRLECPCGPVLTSLTDQRTGLPGYTGTLDPAFPIDRQLAVDATPVVLVNVFTLDEADEETFLRVWHDDALFMKRQPGFISTQLHRAIGESPTYLNYAVWESTAHFRAAFSQPEFRANLSAYPSSAVASPHLFQKVAVPDICVV